MTNLLSAHARIAAILPCYTTAGDSTLIIADDGSTTTLNTKVRTVIQRLAKNRAVDLTALKNKTKAATGRKNLEPLPLAPGLVLVPVKVRKPRINGDATTGYINFYAVTAVHTSTNKPYQATITLSGKAEVPVLWTSVTVNRQFALARLAVSSAPYSLNTLPARSFQETVPGYSTELLTLAIKLVDVFNEILAIKRQPYS